LFDEKEDSLDTHNMVAIFEDVQECMDVFVDKPIANIPFEKNLRIKEIKREQKTLVREACSSVLTPKKEMFPHVFHDPMACYMENIHNQNLQMMPLLSFILGGCYFHPSQQIYQLLDENRQGGSHENHNTVEKVRCSLGLMHMLEDSFASFLETMNSLNIVEILGIKSIYNFPKESLASRGWIRYVKRNQVLDNMLTWLHWHFDFI
jgi:hypothetical protein